MAAKDSVGGSVQSIKIVLLSLFIIFCAHAMEKKEVPAESPEQEVEEYPSLQFACTDDQSDDKIVSYPRDLVKLLSTIGGMLEDLGGSTPDVPIPLHTITKQVCNDVIALLELVVLGTLKDHNLSVPSQLYYQQRQKINAFFAATSNIKDIHDLALAVNYLGAPKIMRDVVLAEYAERLKNMSIEGYKAQLKAINNDLPLPSELVNLMRDRAFIKPILQCLQGIPSIIATSTQKPELCEFMNLKIKNTIENVFNKKSATLAVVRGGTAIRGPNNTLLLSKTVPIIIDIAKKEWYLSIHEAQNHTIKRMVFSNDGTMLVSMGITDPQLIVHKLDKSVPDFIEPEGDEAVPFCAAFSSDSTLLAVGYEDGSLDIHDLKKERSITSVNGSGQGSEIASVAFHPSDNNMLVFSDERTTDVLLAKIDEDNAIIPNVYVRKTLHVGDLKAHVSKETSICRKMAENITFTPDGKWIIGTYANMCKRKGHVAEFTTVFTVRWGVDDLDAPGEVIAFECPYINPPFIEADWIDVQTDMLHQKYAVQVFIKGIQTASQLCVVDFKNKKSGQVHRCNGVAVGYGTSIIYFQNEKNNEVIGEGLTLKIQPLCCTKLFSLVTTTGYDPFVFLNKDATGLVISVDDGRLATYTLYSEQWRQLFEYLKTCPMSLEELHELYVMCMGMSEQGDVSANDVCAQLSRIPALKNAIATRFHILPVEKKAEKVSVSVPKQESGALAKLWAAKNYISKSAGYYAKQLKNEVVPPRSRPLLVAPQRVINQPGVANQPIFVPRRVINRPVEPEPPLLIAEEEEEKVEPSVLIKIIAFPFRMLRLVWKITLGRIVNSFFS